MLTQEEVLKMFDEELYDEYMKEFEQIMNDKVLSPSDVSLIHSILGNLFSDDYDLNNALRLHNEVGDTHIRNKIHDVFVSVNNR